jgi:hypothetical protein
MRAATASVPKLNVGASWRMCRCSDVIAAPVAGSSTVSAFLAPLRILQASTEVIIKLETPDTLNAS